jgi:hypothetical protein
MAFNCCTYHFIFTIIVAWFLLSATINPNHESQKTKETYSIGGKSNFFQSGYEQGIYNNTHTFEMDTFINEKSHNYQIP